MNTSLHRPGAGLGSQRQRATRLGIASAPTAALAFAAIGVHVAAGAAHEQRTVFAMALRLRLWVAIAGCAWWAAVAHSEVKP